MIQLQKINGDAFFLNADHIETIEERPDTVVTLSNDRKYLVKESMEEVVEKIITYNQKIHVKVRTLSVEDLSGYDQD